MNEDIHSEDELFKQAYGRLEEDPSPQVWEKINAQLDGKDAVYYRKRVVTWKRVACLLLLLLGTAVSYQMFFSKEQHTSSAYHPAGTSPDSNQSIALDRQLADNNHHDSSLPKEKNNGDDAAKQPLVKSVDTTNSLRDDQSNRTAAGEVYHSHHYREPLPEQAARNNTNGHPLVQAETRDESFDKTFLLTDASRQEQQKKALPDSALHQEPQATQPAHPTGEKKDDQLVTDMSGLTRLEKDSLQAFAFRIDSLSAQNITAASGKIAKPRKRFTGSWSVTPFASADAIAYKLDDDNHEIGNGGNPPEHHKQEIENRETHQFSFSAGAFIKRQLTPKFSVSTGLIYSNVAISIQPQTLYASKDNNQNVSYKLITSSGYTYVKPVFGSVPVTADSITAQTSQHSIQFLSVPLTFGYTFNAGKRLSITPGVGLSANMLLSSRIRTEVDEDTDKETIVINKLQGVRKTYFSFMADADINYFLSKRFSLSLLPICKYAINPITKDNVVKTFPYSLSIGAGVTYSF